MRNCLDVDLYVTFRDFPWSVRNFPSVFSGYFGDFLRLYGISDEKFSNFLKFVRHSRPSFGCLNLQITRNLQEISSRNFTFSEFSFSRIFFDLILLQGLAIVSVEGLRLKCTSLQRLKCSMFTAVTPVRVSRVKEPLEITLTSNTNLGTLYKEVHSDEMQNVNSLCFKQM